MWIRNQSSEGIYYTREDSDINIQTYGNDPHWALMKVEIESSEIIDLENTEKYKQALLFANQKRDKIKKELSKSLSQKTWDLLNTPILGTGK